jgi:uncharacterized LabA/DUF88 family protein
MFKYKNQRVGVFVDVSNMYHSAKNLYGARINFKEILKEVTAGRQLIRAIAYVIKSHTMEEEPFFDALIQSGFEIKSKDLQIFADGTKKADWDVGLAVDAISLAERLDSIIILSGDGDYVPLVEYLRINKGCMVEVAAFGKTISAKLVEAVDDFLDLSSNAEKFLIMRRSNKRR